MKFKLFILLLFSFSLLFAVNIQQVKNSGDYYYGESYSEIYQEARDEALKKLTEQIVVMVRSSFVNKLKETNFNVDESVESILQTHSLATLKNLLEIKEPCTNGLRVFLYIKKSDVAKVFEERKKLLNDIYTEAKILEEEGNIGNALKWYYFCTILMNSLPDERVVWNGINFSTEIPHRINSILPAIKFNLQNDVKLSEKERRIKLSVRYKNKPVSFIQFTFWDGINQVRVEGKDGYATLELLGASTKFRKLDINIEYIFYSCREEFKAVAELWKVVKRCKFVNKRTIQLEKEPDIFEPEIIGEYFNIVLYNDNDSCFYADNIKNEAVNFLNLLQSSDEDELKNHYASDQFIRDKILRIIKYNHPKPIDFTNTVNINKTYEGWEMRRIPVLTNYPSIHKQTTEYLVLDFNEQGKLVDISFSIMDNLYKEFVEDAKFGKEWGNRSVIIKFIEKYRSAFLNRNVNTLEAIFSDDAVIIVGRVFKKTKKLKDYKYNSFGDQPDANYIRLKKEEYLRRQKAVFDSQQDIYLGFSTFRIDKKNNVEGIYGVSMRQNYNSTVYSDEGYLFLLIDFNEEQPKIYVRCWQPQEWSNSDLIKMANFRVNE